MNAIAEITDAAPVDRAMSRNTIATALAFCALPVLSVILALRIERSAGPYWLGGNSDPEYAYLLNSLSLAIAKMPALSEHPGTTLIAFGAIVLRAIHLVCGKGPIVDDVLTRPELYLFALNYAVLSVFFAAQVTVGWIARRLGYEWGACLLLQAAPLLSMTSVHSLACVKPEALQQPLLALLALAMVWAMAKKSFNDRRTAAAMGVILAAGVVTKVTFFPAWIVVLIVLNGWRERGICVGMSVLASAILLMPIYKLWPHMAGALWGIASHTGMQGAGPAGFVDPSAYATSLWTLIAQEWLSASVVFVGAAVWGASLFAQKKQVENRVLGAVTLAIVAQFLMVAKHPSQHYLQPGLSLLGLELFLIFRILRAHMAARTLAVTALLFLAALSIHQIIATSARAEGFDSMRRAQLKAYEFQQRTPEMKVFYHYRSSSLVSALAFGDGYSGGRFGRDLHRLYPRAFFYSLWHKRYYNFEADLPLETVLKWLRDEPVFLQGTPFEGGNEMYAPANVRLDRVSEPGPEVVYRIFAKPQ